MAISCSKCSKELSDDAIFCTYCGEPVTNNEEEKQKEKAEEQLRKSLIESSPMSVVDYEEHQFEIHERAQKWAQAYGGFTLNDDAYTFLLYQEQLQGLAGFGWAMEKDVFRTNKPNHHEADFFKAAIWWYISEAMRRGVIGKDLTYSPRSIELLSYAYEDISDNLRYKLPDFSEIEALAKKDDELFPLPQPIRVEAAGTVISFTTDESVLIVYMDCVHKEPKHNAKVRLNIKKLYVSQEAQIIERSSGDSKICAAIFRIPIVRDNERNRMEVLTQVKATVWFYLPKFFEQSREWIYENRGSHLYQLYEEITLFKGSVTELDWRGREE